MIAWQCTVVSDPQLRWTGSEKGVIHLATAAVANAIWDLYAKARGKPLWKLICDFSPEEFVKSVCFRYITDAITPEEALAMLKEKESSKKAREEEVIKRGYPAYTTSVGWLGYSDEKIARLTKESLQQGFNHFKVSRKQCLLIRLVKSFESNRSFISIAQSRCRLGGRSPSRNVDPIDHRQPGEHPGRQEERRPQDDRGQERWTYRVCPHGRRQPGLGRLPGCGVHAEVEAPQALVSRVRSRCRNILELTSTSFISIGSSRSPPRPMMPLVTPRSGSSSSPTGSVSPPVNTLTTE